MVISDADTQFFIILSLKIKFFAKLFDRVGMGQGTVEFLDKKGKNKLGDC